MRRLAAVLTLIPLTLFAQATPPAARTPTPAQPPKAATPAKPAPAKAGAAKPAATPPAARTTTRRPASVPAKAAPAPMTDDEKVVYTLGLLLQRSLSQFDLSAGELQVLQRGLADATLHKPAIDLEEWGPKIEPFAAARRARLVVREKAAGEAYLAKAAAEAGATKTASGLVYRDVTAGTGRSPSAGDTVRVNYRGTLIDGTEFDSSYARNEPAEFALGRVIGCWTEGLQHMKVGGKARLVCPSDLAYGDQGSAPIPGGAALIFEVELLGIK